MVQLHEYNEKYLLKITLDQFEQTFKVSVDLVDDVDRLERQLSDVFYNACFQRFLSMREDFNNLLNQQK